MPSDRALLGDPTAPLLAEFGVVSRELELLRQQVRAGAGEAAVAARLEALRREIVRLEVAEAEFVPGLARAWNLGGAAANTTLARAGLLAAAAFNPVETEAAAALVTRTVDALGAVRTALVQGLVRSDPRAVVEAIRDATVLEGLVAFDRGRAGVLVPSGRFWDPEAYARMVSRTAIADARRDSFRGRYLANGADVVRVVANGTTHEICLVWEGEQLSLTGATPGLPTVADAEAAGLFHPNCAHRYVVDPDAAQPGVDAVAPLAAGTVAPSRAILATSPLDPRTPPPTIRPRLRLPASRVPAPSIPGA